MPFQKQNVILNQLATSGDFNEANRLALANLFLAMRHSLAPSNGVIRGGVLTAPGGLFATISPFACVTDNGLAILETAYNLQFSGNTSGSPRIDLVSVGYIENATDAEQRDIINTNDDSIFQSTVNTKITGTALVRISLGTPGLVPSVPSTPVGHVPLYAVRVANGQTQLTAADFTRQDAGYAERLRLVNETLSTTPVPEPFVASRTLGLVVPAGSAALLIGTARARPETNPVLAVAPLDPVVVTIEDAANPFIPVAAGIATPIAAISPTMNATIATEQTVSVFGFVPGPSPLTQYRLRVSRGTAGEWIAWTNVIVESYSLIAVLA